MILPKSILVHKRRYKIIYTDKGKIKKGDDRGYCMPHKYIRIYTGQSKAAQLRTLIHELMHAIEAEYQLEFDHDKVVYALEGPIYKIIKDNIRIGFGS